MTNRVCPVFVRFHVADKSIGEDKDLTGDGDDGNA